MTVYDLQRNDVQSALDVLRAVASVGPVRPELLRSLALLQDDPSSLIRLSKQIHFDLVRPAWDQD